MYGYGRLGVNTRISPLWFTVKQRARAPMQSCAIPFPHKKQPMLWPGGRMEVDRMERRTLNLPPRALRECWLPCAGLHLELIAPHELQHAATAAPPALSAGHRLPGRRALPPLVRDGVFSIRRTFNTPMGGHLKLSAGVHGRALPAERAKLAGADPAADAAAGGWRPAARAADAAGRALARRVPGHGVRAQRAAEHCLCVGMALDFEPALWAAESAAAGARL